MKRYQVFICCMELPSAHAEYTYSLNASAFHVAANEALKQFRREPYVQRRRLKCLDLRITAVGAARPRTEIILPLGDKVSGGV